MAAALLLVALATTVQAEEQGEPRIISGFVLNGTFKDRPVTDQEVLLRILTRSEEEVTAAVRTDEAGRFRFSVVLDPESRYRIVTSYRGIQYTGRAPGPAQGETGNIQILKIYETTTDASELLLDSYHVIIDPSERGLQVQEILSIRTTGRRTYTGTETAPLYFTLPKSASNVTLSAVLPQVSVGLKDGAVSFSAPVSPEGIDVAYRYDLPAAGRSQILTPVLPLPAGAFHLFISVPGVTVGGALLRQGEPVETEQFRYSHFLTGELRLGTQVEILLENLPQPKPLAAPLLALFGTLMVVSLALLFPFLRMWLPAARPEGPAARGRPEGRSLRNQLIGEIARLDEEFGRGRLAEQAYRRLRAEKKDKLLALVRADLPREGGRQSPERQAE